ncbi:glycoside hydrolase family 2 TIM barrel-domain containing protein [Streptomyces boninensis]|uniref:glycoside hydrolase family 2 TIM barrel-domain containing protein n=1 Tax=Streptomyces boninensis TaxID=2039455 RepID=UPI003B20D767
MNDDALDRRSFAAGSFFLTMASAGLAVPAAAATRDDDSAPQQAVRVEGRRTGFDTGWRFELVDAEDASGADAAAADPAYDDSSWRDVTLPHDWSIERLPAADGGVNAGTGWFQGGLGWYRKEFVLPASLDGSRVSLEFDGVYMDCEVYLDGRLLVSHPYGYTGFAADLTDLVHTDGRTSNVVAVKVRNPVPTSRWYTGSGIYRHVHLVVTAPVHVARHGVFVTTPGLERTASQGYADVRVRTSVADNRKSPGTEVTVVSTVQDPQGRIVGTDRTTVTTGAEPTTATGKLRISRPRLWSTDEPTLYTLKTELYDGTRRLDRTTTRFGMRYFAIDPDSGFSLNGTSMKLQGVNLHHDLGALGAAVNADAIERQLRIMRSMGVNSVRLSHNPPSPEMLALCDRMGFLAIDEAFDMWSRRKVTNDYSRFFDEHSDADLREMVNAAKNSPSVIMWSVGNEIPDTTVPEGVPIARRLIDTVRSMDPTRPVVMGSDKYRTLPAKGSPQDVILRMLDGVGVNYNTAVSVDDLHAAYPDTFFFESESAAQTSTRGSYQDPDQLNTGQNYSPGRRDCSSYDNMSESWSMQAEYTLKKDRDRPWYAGQFLWAGIDYLGEPTPYDVFPVRSSFFGAVDTAGLPKDNYYLFRSQWTSDPMVHLLPMDWTSHKEGDIVQVRAYANADTVELFLDGRSLGIRRFDRKRTTDGRPYLETTEATHDDKTVTSGAYPGSYTSPGGSAGHLHLTWDVPFRPGRLAAVARRDGRVVARDEVATAGAAHGLRLRADRAAIPGDGRSLAFVTAEVIDAHGVVVPTADDLVTWDVSGPGLLAGLDNGRQEDAEGHRGPSRTVFKGKGLAIIQSQGRPGPIRVTARASGLRSATATVTATSSSTAITPRPAPSTPVVPPIPLPEDARADASYSGSEDTLPQQLLDGDTTTVGWSNLYVKPASLLLPEFSLAHPEEWVSVAWPDERDLEKVTAYFTVDESRALPKAVRVSTWNGRAWVPADGVHIDWATGSHQPTAIRFDRARTTRIRLLLTSVAPDTPHGFLGIAHLEF